MARMARLNTSRFSPTRHLIEKPNREGTQRGVASTKERGNHGTHGIHGNVKFEILSSPAYAPKGFGRAQISARRSAQREDGKSETETDPQILTKKEPKILNANGHESRTDG